MTLPARIRRAIVEGRQNEVMYHVGRPGEDGFTERILAAWGVDGHNSHTNICSSAARAGYHLWMGCDRPSPDYANADVILLISAHLESGHYFNPHAQRIIEAKKAARRSSSSTRACRTRPRMRTTGWPPYPGSEAAILLAIANHLIRTGRYHREFVRRWWNWQEYLAARHPGAEQTFEDVRDDPPGAVSRLHVRSTPRPSRVSTPAVIARVAEAVAARRHAAGDAQLAQRLVRQPRRMADCALPVPAERAHRRRRAPTGGVYPNAWNKFVPKPIHLPPHPPKWNDLTWPLEYPLALNEMSFLLPHFLKDGRAGSTCTSRASTIRSGPILTASAGSRSSPTSSSSACTSP